MNLIKIFITLLIISVSLLSKDLYFFMPKESKSAEKELIHQISKAQKSIDIAIYSFTNKKIKKALAKATKKGVKIRIVTDKKGAYKRNRTGELAKLRNVSGYVVDGKKAKNGKYYGKMHLKLAIIDKKTLCHGSANWSKSGFGLNYETFIVQEDKELAEKFTKFYEEIVEVSSPY